MSTDRMSDTDFWSKVGRIFRKAGRKVIEPALLLYYSAQRPETPAWAKTVVVSALLYLVSPVDAVPDALPVVGFSDDLGVLLAAVGTIAAYIDDDVRGRVRRKLDDWFGRKD